MRRYVKLIGLLAILGSSVAAQARPVVVLLTDFGLENEAVGLCHGAILSVDTEIAVVDLAHSVPAHDIAAGARILARASNFPKGTVFVAVVDPGVGTSRPSIAIRTKRGRYYVAPDNGLLSEIVRRDGVAEAVRLDPKRINPDWEAGTFDGRDLYSPAGALLASSGGDLKRLGDPVKPEKIVMLPATPSKLDLERGCVTGIYTRTDEPFGNVWSNITADDLEQLGIETGNMLEVRIGAREEAIPFVTTFSDVPRSAPLAYINSNGRLAFALNMANLKQAWKLSEGAKVVVQSAAIDVTE